MDREHTTPTPSRSQEIKHFFKMSFSSAEMAAFIVRLPVVLGEFVSYEDNPYYEIFLLLIEIFVSLLLVLRSTVGTFEV
jgi:hypothetical protein